jgi:hypothetical protein
MKGLRALGSNSQLVRPASTRKLLGSVDVDKALRPDHANEACIDYGVGYSEGKRSSLTWIEVHPANPSGLTEVIHKFVWWQSWLTKAAPGLNAPQWIPSSGRRFVWITSGSVSSEVVRQSRRRLQDKGIHGPVSVLELP